MKSKVIENSSSTGNRNSPKTWIPVDFCGWKMARLLWFSDLGNQNYMLL